MSSRRALHYVFKVGNRTETTKFYRDVLGMKFLRHEEFEEGCEAACNGPYDGKWSKSMVGYGPEDTHFVMELTYNYGIGSYTLGNDFQGVQITSGTILERARSQGLTVEDRGDGAATIRAPDGYPFHIKAGGEESTVTGVSLSVTDLQKSVEYWRDLCGMTLYSHTPQDRAVLGYGQDQASLELVQIEGKVAPATAGGRIAFSCPTDQLAGIQEKMTTSGQTILKPLVSLDTPGKATVHVVILADPDGHEICFVGDEAFTELSQVDPKADQLLDEAIAADKSEEWFAKKGRTKAAAS